MDKKMIIQFAWLFGLLALIASIAVITAPDKINRLEFIEKRMDDIQEQREVLTQQEKQLEKLATEKEWQEVDNDNNK
tara:strand:- start:253 stop:483 length:231 start_codon:yes stop_codon:yes gene_type:complete